MDKHYFLKGNLLPQQQFGLLEKSFALDPKGTIQVLRQHVLKLFRPTHLISRHQNFLIPTHLIKKVEFWKNAHKKKFGKSSIKSSLFFVDSKTSFFHWYFFSYFLLTSEFGHPPAHPPTSLLTQYLNGPKVKTMQELLAEELPENCKI